MKAWARLSLFSTGIWLLFCSWCQLLLFLKGNTSLVTYFYCIPPWENELRHLSAGKLLHHFHLKSLWSYLCMRYTGRWAWNLILYLLLIVFISICLAKWSVLTWNLKHKWLSSCQWFQFKAVTVLRIFMFNCMGFLALILKVYQRSILELLLFAHRCTSVRKMLASLVQSFDHFPFLSWSAVFVVFCPTVP